MRVPGESLQAQLNAAGRLVHRRAVGFLALLALGAIALVLVASWALGALWPQPTPWPLLLDALLLAALAGGWRYWRLRMRHRLGRRQVAAAAEHRLGLGAGSLNGVLELRDHLPVGTSRALVERAERALEARTRPHTAGELAGELGERWRRRLQAAGPAVVVVLMAVAALAFTTPERTRAGWMPLLHPVLHLQPPPLPALVVVPGDAEVPRGEPLEVRVLASGREAVTLSWRLQGDVTRSTVLPVRGDSATGRIPAVTAAGSYRVGAPDGAVSPEYRLTATDALMLSDLIVEVVYPRYLERTPERFEGDVPPLEVPAGTTLRVAGRATRPLAAVTLQGARDHVQLETDGVEFHGSWQPAGSGRYAWVLRERSPGAPPVAPPPLEITIIDDQAPTVTITFPGVDTVLPPDFRQPVLADARDDYGLAEATLVSWRVRAGGGEEPPVANAVPLQTGGDRSLLNTLLDASARALGPGDTLRYFLRVRDTSPARQTGVSATYSLWLPTGAELRRQARDEAEDVVAQTEMLSKRAADLQRQTRNADRNARAANARRGSRAGESGGQPGREPGQLRFEDTDEARRVVGEQRDVLDQVDQLRAALEQLQQSMDGAGLRDEDLRRRLREAQELLEQLAAPEQRSQLAALEEALRELDPAELQRALERMAQQQQDLQEQLDRTLELMREAARTQELAALSQEAKELATQQRALAEAHADPSSAAESRSRAEQQEALAERTDSLKQQLDALRDQAGQETGAEARERTDSATASMGAARDAMRQAATSAAAQQPQQAGAQGKAAAEALEEAAEQLDEARSQAAAERQQATAESMQQAARDALALAQQQQQLQQQMEQARSGQPQAQAQPQPGQQTSSGDQAGKRPDQQGQQQQQGAQEGGQRPEQAGGQDGGDQRGQGSGGQQGGGATGEPGGSDVGRLRVEQGAVQQGLEQLGRNVTEAGEQSGAVTREVAAALNRANTAMGRIQRALQEAERREQLPAEQAAQAVDALNRLALSLLQNAQQMRQTDGGSGLQQAAQQLADLAQQQGSINGQANSLQPLNLSPGAQGEQVRRLGREQTELADKLGGLNDMLGGREDMLGQVDALAREAQSLGRELQGGRLTGEAKARQQRLFHRLLDAGRSLEQEETSDERTAERPGAVTTALPAAVDPAALEGAARYRAPGPEELRALPAAYRRLILDYFERLNRPAPPAPERRQ